MDSYGIGCESLHQKRLAKGLLEGRPPRVPELDEIHDLCLLWVCLIELSDLYHGAPQSRRDRSDAASGSAWVLRTLDGLLLRGPGRLVLCREALG